MPGLTPQQALETQTWEGAAERYPEGVPDDVVAILKHELRLIEMLQYAPYFLTVNSIVRFARSQDILCQGRGSAANSAVCYVLGITSIDPERNDLLFERFVSEERREPPDIDVDFEHERREIVMQWVFETYGRNHAALCSTVIRYRAKGALRDVGKALGLPEDLIKTLSSQVSAWGIEGVEPQHAEELNLNLGDRRLRLALTLARELIGAPRHLSQHPGGFVPRARHAVLHEAQLRSAGSAQGHQARPRHHPGRGSAHLRDDPQSRHPRCLSDREPCPDGNAAAHQTTHVL
jgi:error-prone DNA polymerase